MFWPIKIQFKSGYKLERILSVSETTELKVKEHLTLKVLTNSDAEDLYSLIDSNRDHLNEWLSWVDFTSCPKDCVNFINFATEIHQNNGAPTFGLFYKSKLAGVVSFHPIDKKNRQAE